MAHSYDPPGVEDGRERVSHDVPYSEVERFHESKPMNILGIQSITVPDSSHLAATQP